MFCILTNDNNDKIRELQNTIFSIIHRTSDHIYCELFLICTLYFILVVYISVMGCSNLTI